MSLSKSEFVLSVLSRNLENVAVRTTCPNLGEHGVAPLALGKALGMTLGMLKYQAVHNAPPSKYVYLCPRSTKWVFHLAPLYPKIPAPPSLSSANVDVQLLGPDPGPA